MIYDFVFTDYNYLKYMSINDLPWEILDIILQDFTFIEKCKLFTINKLFRNVIIHYTYELDEPDMDSKNYNIFYNIKN